MTASEQTISQRAYVCFIAVCVLSLLHSAFVQLADPLQLNWDPSMYLHFAQWMIRGGMPYVDFVDINPPLIIYLSCLPAWLSSQLDLHIIVVFKLLMVLLSFASFAMILSTVQRRLKRDEKALYIALVLLVFANTGSCLGREFGQREHIFVLTFLPFFFVRWMRWENEKINMWIAAISGAMAAVGLCLKPHFLVMPLICELFWIFRHRSWKKILSPEVISLGVVGSLYPIHFLLIPDAMRKPFMQLIAEFPLFQHYYASSLLVCCLLGGNHWPEIFVAFICAVVVGISLRKQHVIVLPLFLYMLAGYACVILQHKHWDYYKIPMWIGILMLGGVLLAWLVDLVATKIFKAEIEKVFFPVVAVAAVAVGVSFVAIDIPKIASVLQAFKLEEPRGGRTLSVDLERALSLKAQTYPTLSMLMKHARPGDRAMMICEILMPEYPAVVQYGLEMGCRYPFQFPMVLNEQAQIDAEKNHDQQAVDKFKKRVVEEQELVLTDVRNRKPQVIIVLETVYPKLSFPALAESLKQSRFSERLLSDYQFAESYEDKPDTLKLRYKVYVRTAPSPK